MTVTPFTVRIDQQVLDDLAQRIARTRWTDEVEDAGWNYGTNQAYLRELLAYWRDQFDWRRQEALLNQFAHFRAEVDGFGDSFGLHFIHERGSGDNPIPLLLTHGWPDSFFRFYKIIPMLTHPEQFGGDPADSFTVVVPSLPGFSFSDRPAKKGMDEQRVAELLSALMTKTLGYSRYAAHGGDLGSGITQTLAQRHGDDLIGIHLVDVPYKNMYMVDASTASEAERAYLQEGEQWGMREGAYAMLHSTRPQTLGYGLNDSPAGLASWIVEKFYNWSDCNGNLESRFTKDELLTNITMYWATQTINSSIRYYRELQSWGDEAGGQDWSQSEGWAQDAAQEAAQGAAHEAGSAHEDQGWQQGWGSVVDVPTAVAIFPKDLVHAPREFGERFFNIQQWTEMPRGGHFSALEEPELLVNDIREFFRPLRQK